MIAFLKSLVNEHNYIEMHDIHFRLAVCTVYNVMHVNTFFGGERACLERFNECLLKNWLSFQLALYFLPVIKCQVKATLGQKTDNDIHNNLSDCGFAV